MSIASKLFLAGGTLRLPPLLACTLGAAFAAAPGGDSRVILQTPGLVAFWTFGEEAGQPRRSLGTPHPHPLAEVGGPIARAPGGPFSGFAAEGRTTIGLFGGLAVFNRALTEAEMKRLHDAANLPNPGKPQP
jgi:hypothetical protein